MPDLDPRMPMPAPFSRFPAAPVRVAFGIAFCVAVLAILAFPPSAADDAYITFRYARNLAEHGELNWNVGEDPVEGYTGARVSEV